MLSLLTVLFASANGQYMDIKGPVSSHFLDFLESKNDEYSLDSIYRTGSTGSFGGRVVSDESVYNVPWVFIHGNSDSALNHGNTHSTGWNRNIEYFIQKGYTMAEMYGITYGDRKIENSIRRKHNCHDLKGLRGFLENVLEYTKKEQVDIMAHSMGVSYARRIIRGGTVFLEDEVCNLGPSLAHRIRNFFAIAGANYGMCLCTGGLEDTVEACGIINGYYGGSKCVTKPSMACNSQKEPECKKVDNYSMFLRQMNDEKHKEAEFIFSMWSVDDNVLGPGSLAWGRVTALVPESKSFKQYKGVDHYKIKHVIMDDVWHAMQNHYF